MSETSKKYCKVCFITFVLIMFFLEDVLLYMNHYIQHI